MSGSRKRVEPRHVDADKLRISLPTGPLPMLGMVVAVVLAVGGIAAVSAGLVPVGDDQIRTLGAEAHSDGPSDRPSPGNDAPPDESDDFNVVEATRIVPLETGIGRPGRLLRERVERAATPTIDEFGVAMLNILGSQHTAGGKGGFAPGTSRAYAATSMLVGRGASIIGFSEIQRDQLGVFLNNAPGYDVYPGTSLGSAGVPTTVAWNTAVWELVETQVIYIPFSGQVRPQPVVKLANVESGVEVWVMNVHNSPNGMEGERDRAEVVEIAKINELAATGDPIIVMGDFNEKQEILCRITAATPLESTIGGGSCYPPPQPMRVDWIFASPALSFGTYEVTRAAPVPYITDHAALFSRLSLE